VILVSAAGWGGPVPLPPVIPIAREADYRTSTIGRYDLGQFFAWVTAAYLPDERVGSDWRERQRWYAAVHRFDRDGNHASSDAWCPGPGTKDGVAEDGVAERLRLWLDDHPPVSGDGRRDWARVPSPRSTASSCARE